MTLLWDMFSKYPLGKVIVQLHLQNLKINAQKYRYTCELMWRKEVKMFRFVFQKQKSGNKYSKKKINKFEYP